MSLNCFSSCSFLLQWILSASQSRWDISFHYLHICCRNNSIQIQEENNEETFLDVFQSRSHKTRTELFIIVSCKMKVSVLMNESRCAVLWIGLLDSGLESRGFSFTEWTLVAASFWVWRRATVRIAVRTFPKTPIALNFNRVWKLTRLIFTQDYVSLLWPTSSSGLAVHFKFFLSMFLY